MDFFSTNLSFFIFWNRFYALSVKRFHAARAATSREHFQIQGEKVNRSAQLSRNMRPDTYVCTHIHACAFVHVGRIECVIKRESGQVGLASSPQYNHHLVFCESLPIIVHPRGQLWTELDAIATSKTLVWLVTIAQYCEQMRRIYVYIFSPRIARINYTARP